jgi:hypothetical protein
LQDNGAGSITTNPFSRVSFYNTLSTGLAAFLGLGSGFDPTDNFSNLSAGTLANDPGFGGNYLLFTASISGFMIDANSPPQTLTNELDFLANLPGGSFVTGLFVIDPSQCSKNCDIGTAASGHLVQTLAAPVPGPIVGAGIPGLCGALMLWLARRRQLRNGRVAAA